MTWQTHGIQTCNVKMCISHFFLLDARFMKQERCQCRGDSAQAICSTEEQKHIKIDFWNICFIGTYSGGLMFQMVASSVDPELQDSSGWKGPQVVSSPTSCSKQGSSEVRTDCTGLSHQVLTTSKDRDSTASLGSLLHCWVVLMRRSFSSLLSMYAHYFLLSHPVLPWRAWLQLLINSL